MKYQAIKAGYPRRGGGKGGILPLLSDLDFTVIEEGMGEDNRKSLRRSYERLAHATTVLDRSLELYVKETFYSGIKEGVIYLEATWSRKRV